jgi:hypothetical protein
LQTLLPEKEATCKGPVMPILLTSGSFLKRSGVGA